MTFPARAARPALPSLLLALGFVALVVSGCDDPVTPAPSGQNTRVSETRAPDPAQAPRSAEVKDEQVADSEVPPAAPMGARMLAPEPEVVVLSTAGVRAFRESFQEFLDAVPASDREVAVEAFGERMNRELMKLVRGDGGRPRRDVGEEELLLGALEVLESFDGLRAETLIQEFRAANPGWEPGEGRTLAGGSGAPRRKGANESAAIATLKNIASAQAQCQASAVIDVNQNGAGEFGVFAELSGAKPVRGTEELFTPPVLSAAFGNVENGRVQRSGYIFQMWLPRHAGGVYSAENPDGGIDTFSVDAPLSEVIWRCYAWPVESGLSGDRVFVVDQSGDVLACRNTMNWSGVHNGPAADAAAGSEPWSLSVNETSRNGEEWIVVR